MAVTAWPAADPGFYGAAGQWNDIDCDNNLNFIVEYPVDATYADGILTAENIIVGDKKYRAELGLVECDFYLLPSFGSNGNPQWQQSIYERCF